MICDNEPNKNGAHNWKCGTLAKPGFCAFAFSSACPSPRAEWQALQDGASAEEAFAFALADMESGYKLGPAIVLPEQKTKKAPAKRKVVKKAAKPTKPKKIQ